MNLRLVSLPILAGLLAAQDGHTQPAPATPAPAATAPTVADMSHFAETFSRRATALFRDGCVAHVGDAAASTAALTKAGFVDAGHPMSEFLSQGRPSDVLMLNAAPVRMAAITLTDGTECSLVEQIADATLAERDFRAMVAALAPETVTEIPDAPRLADDPMRVISFRVAHAGQPGAVPDQTVSLHLDKTVRSFFPAKLTSLAAAPPPAPLPPIDASVPPRGKQP